jgi:hypothetical protein
MWIVSTLEMHNHNTKGIWWARPTTQKILKIIYIPLKLKLLATFLPLENVNVLLNSNPPGLGADTHPELYLMRSMRLSSIRKWAGASGGAALRDGFLGIVYRMKSRLKSEMLEMTNLCSWSIDNPEKSQYGSFTKSEEGAGLEEGLEMPSTAHVTFWGRVEFGGTRPYAMTEVPVKGRKIGQIYPSREVIYDTIERKRQVSTSTTRENMRCTVKTTIMRWRGPLCSKSCGIRNPV